MLKLIVVAEEIVDTLIAAAREKETRQGSWDALVSQFDSEELADYINSRTIAIEQELAQLNEKLLASYTEEQAHMSYKLDRINSSEISTFSDETDYDQVRKEYQASFELDELGVTRIHCDEQGYSLTPVTSALEGMQDLTLPSLDTLESSYKKLLRESITEKLKGISSWSRLMVPEKEDFLGGLIYCIKETKQEERENSNLAFRLVNAMSYLESMEDNIAEIYRIDGATVDQDTYKDELRRRGGISEEIDDQENFGEGAELFDLSDIMGDFN